MTDISPDPRLLTEFERSLTATFLEVLQANKEVAAAMIGLVAIAFCDLREGRPADAQQRLGELLAQPQMVPLLAHSVLQRARTSGAVN